MKTKVLKKVSLGNLDGYGTTKTEAAANLDKQLQWIAGNVRNVSIECRFGLVGILTPSSEGWSYTIVDQDQIAKEQGQVWSCCMFGYDMPYTDALCIMRNAMCQRAWSYDVKDDAEFIARANCGKNESSNLKTLFAHYRAQKTESQS